jgi:hypothetical protein
MDDTSQSPESRCVIYVLGDRFTVVTGFNTALYCSSVSKQSDFFKYSKLHAHVEGIRDYSSLEERRKDQSK